MRVVSFERSWVADPRRSGSRPGSPRPRWCADRPPGASPHWPGARPRFLTRQRRLRAPELSNRHIQLGGTEDHDRPALDDSVRSERRLLHGPPDGVTRHAKELDTHARLEAAPIVV